MCATPSYSLWAPRVLGTFPSYCHGLFSPGLTSGETLGTSRVPGRTAGPPSRGTGPGCVLPSDRSGAGTRSGEVDLAAPGSVVVLLPLMAFLPITLCHRSLSLHFIWSLSCGPFEIWKVL